ncbi:arginine repressor [Massilia violacea]|uniref:Arginine repressor n=1 Tax=Pseudoduganella violacea TaxID=1715466 RepID=A0A7W5BFS4_9BURK|nr:arginine repressor [Pseudoduganella violacea]
MALRSRVHELFIESRSSAGSRSIMGMMREEGMAIGRFKVSRLMEELGLCRGLICPDTSIGGKSTI